MTQPTRISLVRDTDNPWYEVVLTEGRNREIRKMFEEVGHFVEKVRRVGFGPLILDVKPGETRELNEEGSDPTETRSTEDGAASKVWPRDAPQAGAQAG